MKTERFGGYAENTMEAGNGVAAIEIKNLNVASDWSRIQTADFGKAALMIVGPNAVQPVLHWCL